MNQNYWNWKLVGVDNVLLVLLPQSRLSIRIRLTKTVEQDQYLTALHKRFACRVLPDKIDHFLDTNKVPYLSLLCFDVNNPVNVFKLMLECHKLIDHCSNGLISLHLWTHTILCNSSTPGTGRVSVLKAGELGRGAHGEGWWRRRIIWPRLKPGSNTFTTKCSNVTRENQHYVWMALVTYTLSWKPMASRDIHFWRLSMAKTCHAL